MHKSQRHETRAYTLKPNDAVLQREIGLELRGGKGHEGFVCLPAILGISDRKLSYSSSGWIFFFYFFGWSLSARWIVLLPWSGMGGTLLPMKKTHGYGYAYFSIDYLDSCDC